MASKVCTNFNYKFYNGGWSDWSANLHGGYASDGSGTDRVAVFRFKTPAIDGLYTNTSLVLTIPYVRQPSAAESGTLYVKLYTSDPEPDSGAICANHCPSFSVLVPFVYPERHQTQPKQAGGVSSKSNFANTIIGKILLVLFDSL